jgi:hypothetical protein
LSFTDLEERDPSKPPLRLGALGIPITDDEDEEEEEELEESPDDAAVVPNGDSTTANLPYSPPAPVEPVVPPARTYSRGGSTRSGSSARHVDTGDYREIVRPFAVLFSFFLD